MEKSKLLNVSLTYKTNTKKAAEKSAVFFCIIKYIVTKILRNCFCRVKPLTYRAFFDIIAQNKYRTDVLCNLFLFILCVNDIINKVHEVQ